MDKATNKALLNWLDANRTALTDRGIAASVVDGQQKSSYGVNFDSQRFVGSVFYWPSGTYEVQFNDCASGEVVLLETTSIDNAESLAIYLESVIFNRLYI